MVFIGAFRTIIITLTHVCTKPRKHLALTHTQHCIIIACSNHTTQCRKALYVYYIRNQIGSFFMVDPRGHPKTSSSSSLSLSSSSFLPMNNVSYIYIYMCVCRDVQHHTKCLVLVSYMHNRQLPFG